MTKQDIILLGGGGHAHILRLFLARAECNLLGFISPNRADMRTESPENPDGMAWLGDDEWLIGAGLEQHPAAKLINGIGSIGVTLRRQEAFRKARAAGWSFADYRHPSAIIDPQITTGMGVQILAGAIVQPGCTIGDNVLVNTACVLEHDVRIADHVHIAPRACLCGAVRIQEAAHIGAGALVLQGCTIGRGAVIGAGAVVTKDVAPGETVIGITARSITARKTND